VPEGTAHTPRAYGLGPQQRRIVANTQASRNILMNDIGLAVGDLVGRSELLVLAGSLSEARPDSEPAPAFIDTAGARAVWTHRRFAVHTTVDAWWLGFEDHAIGAGATGHLHRRGATGRLDIRSGAYAETGSNVSGAALTGRMEAARWTGLGPVLAGASLDASGRLGLTSHTSTIGNGTLGLFLSQPDWAIRASGQWAGSLDDRLAVGDMKPELQPDVRTLGTVWWPTLYGSLPAGTSGAQRARTDLRSFGQVVGLFGEMAWLDCAAGPCDAPDRVHVLGIDAQAGSQAQPIGTIPGVRFETGLACHATQADGTFNLKQCQDWEQYAIWFSVRLEPGQPPAYPH